MQATHGAWSQARRALIAAALAVSVLAAGLTPQPAQAQGEVRVVSGTIVEMADGRATISTNTGPVVVQMGDDTRYEKEGRGVIGDVRPNDYVAVTGRPMDGAQVALLVRVFPVVQSTVPARANSPMTGANTGNLMTNAIVQSITDGRLTVRAAGETVSIAVNASTEVRRPEPASAAEVTEGGRIAALGIMDGEGVLQARLVNIVPAPPG
jgi:hypothetical protein